MFIKFWLKAAGAADFEASCSPDSEDCVSVSMNTDVHNDEGARQAPGDMGDISPEKTRIKGQWSAVIWSGRVRPCLSEANELYFGSNFHSPPHSDISSTLAHIYGSKPAAGSRKLFLDTTPCQINDGISAGVVCYFLCKR